MKQLIIYYSIITLMLCSACNNDEPQYADLPELEVNLSQSEYVCALGNVIRITPQIHTDISNDDLAFYWEVGQDQGYSNRTKFTPIFEGRNLEYTCELNEVFNTPSTYTMRLRIKQLSNNRDFYSQHFKLRITGQTGLMILYGDAQSSDIALVADELFTEISSDQKYILPQYFSDNNQGRKIPGEGRFITQLQGGHAKYANYHSVLAVTDVSSAAADYISMQE